MSDRTLTNDMLGRLERHYIKPSEVMPGGIFVPECGINGSQGSSSRCDALYVGFTSTSGRILVGHEIKVFRADWHHELDQPGKADAWADQCHAWYVVAPSTTIVAPAEVPPGWGLMVVNPRSKTRLDIKIPAKVKPAPHAPSWDAVRSIMARQDTLRAQQIADAHHTAREQINAEVDRRVANQPILTHEQHQRLCALEQLEASLGVQVVHGWSEEEGQVRPDVLAAALHLIRATSSLPRYPLGGLAQAARDLADRVDDVTEAAAAWQKVSHL